MPGSPNLEQPGGDPTRTLRSETVHGPFDLTTSGNHVEQFPAFGVSLFVEGSECGAAVPYAHWILQQVMIVSEVKKRREL